MTTGMMMEREAVLERRELRELLAAHVVQSVPPAL